MPGGLLNIIAIGNANVFLTGSPTKTFFKVVYSKYTNFGLQKFRIDYEGQRDLRLTEPSTFTFKIPRYAELLMDTYVAVNLPDIWSPIYQPTAQTGNVWSPYEFNWIHNLGTHMIQEILITCGSQTLQKYSGEYLASMVERDFSADKKELFYRMTGNVPELNDPANSYSRANAYPSAYYTKNTTGAEPSIRGRTLYIPINTWFTLESRCAFPLVSLQYNELYITITMRPIQDLFQVRDVFDPTNNFPYVRPDFNQPQFQMYRFLQTPPAIRIDPLNYKNTVSNWNADIHLISTYCFLSKEESQLFAGEDQVYLVKDVFQYDFQNVAGSNRVKLTSTGMVSSWMWYFQRNDVNLRNEWSNYTNWPYRNLPVDVVLAPTSSIDASLNYIGPYFNPDKGTTGIYISGNFAPVNNKDIMQTMGVVLNGEYRENLLTREVYDYIEKYARTPGSAKDGIYCYNFCLNTSPFEYQPSGAINLSKFKDVQLEFTTMAPTVDLVNSNYQVICDGKGNPIGINKQNWQLFEYNYNLTVFEERYNVLSFIGGNCGMLYAR
jgi:hypothetical protein